MRERITAADQLARILYLLPLAARQEGVTLDELADAIGASKTIVLRDLQEVMAREYYLTAGAGDDIRIDIVGERVTVRTTGDFRRPTRLTHREALALGLGLRALAAEAEPDRRTQLLGLAAKLETGLTVPDLDRDETRNAASSRSALEPDRQRLADLADDGDHDVLSSVDMVRSPLRGPTPPPAHPHHPPAPFGLTPGHGADPDILAALGAALREREACRIVYLKMGAPEPEPRRIRPYLLAHAQGRMYILAHDTGRDGLRVFRVDRVLDVEPDGERFEPPADLDVDRYISNDGAFFHAEDEFEVTVRYSPRIARWIAERAEHEPLDDGAVLVRHRVADTRWIVRHVLQYGPDAVVLEPAEIRTLTAEAAARLAG